MEYASIALLPMTISNAIVPGQNLINILLLGRSDRGKLKASACVGGLTSVRLLQGLVFSLILPRIFIPDRSPSFLDGVSARLTRKSRPITIGVSLIFGLLFLVQGARGLFGSS